MSSTVVALLPIIAVSAVMPIWIILVLLLLRGQRGVLVASAFVAGATLTRLVQGVLFGLVFSDLASGDGQNESRTIVSVLLLVLGVLLLAGAVRKLFGDSEEDPDAPPPRWKTIAGSVGPLAAFGMGALMLLIAMKHWVFLLGAIGTIHDGGLNRTQGIAAYLIFVLGAQSLMIAPIAFAALSPGRADVALGHAERWLEVHKRTIGVVVSGVFGCYFLWKGLSGLL